MLGREPTPSLPYVRTEPQIRGRRPRNGRLALAASLLVLTTTALTEAPNPTPTPGAPQPVALPAPVLSSLPQVLRYRPRPALPALWPDRWPMPDWAAALTSRWSTR